MNSALYLGRVTHTRHVDVAHRFSYRSWWLLIDLDELPRLDRSVRGFGYNRRALVSFRDEDHGPRDGSSPRAWADARCAEAGIALDGGAVRVLAHPRVLGYVFNPLSVWFCHGPGGELRAVIYAVSNTWREDHAHVVAVDESAQRRPNGLLRHSFDKRLFVSPFMDTDHRYTFWTREPSEEATVLTRQVTADGRPALTASLQAERMPLNGRGVAAAMRWSPHVTLLTIARIHRQAFALWRKGAPYRRRGAPPVPSVTIERQRVGTP